MPHRPLQVHMPHASDVWPLDLMLALQYFYFALVGFFPTVQSFFGMETFSLWFCPFGLCILLMIFRKVHSQEFALSIREDFDLRNSRLLRLWEYYVVFTHRIAVTCLLKILRYYCVYLVTSYSLRKCVWVDEQWLLIVMWYISLTRWGNAILWDK